MHDPPSRETRATPSFKGHLLRLGSFALGAVGYFTILRVGFVQGMAMHPEFSPSVEGGALMILSFSLLPLHVIILVGLGFLSVRSRWWVSGLVGAGCGIGVILLWFSMCGL